MALYLAVAAVQAEGDPVDVAPDREAVGVSPGRRLIAVVNNGAWQSAIDVSHPDTYRRLQKRLGEGVWRELHLYSLDEDRALALVDGRRATMLGQPVPPPAQSRRR
jgi:hypothetical protein